MLNEGMFLKSFKNDSELFDLGIKSKINTIFEDGMGEKVLIVRDSSKGVEQIVKDVQTNVGRYVIKFPRMGKKSTTHRERLVGFMLGDRAKVPKVVLSDEKYIVQEYIEGEDLRDTKLDEESFRNVYNEVGELLKELHSIKMEGFGFVDKDFNGEKQFLKEAVYENRGNYLIYILKNNILSTSQVKRLIDYLDDNDHFTNIEESVLLHFDLEDWNIRVKNGKLSGVIDFGDLYAGPSVYEFARPSIGGYRDDRMKHILESYGEINQEALDYFIVTTLVWMLFRHHSMQNWVKLKRDIEILEGIV